MAPDLIFVAPLTSVDSRAYYVHELLRAATLAGGDALGRPDLGRLEAGAKADILVYDMFKPHLQPVWDPLKNVVWKGHGGDLAFAMVHGEPVLHDGRLLKVDEHEIMRQAAQAARKIWKLGEDRGILPAPALRSGPTDT